MANQRGLSWQVKLTFLVMMVLVSHSQVIKISFNKTKAINDEFSAINNKRRSHNAPNLYYDNGLCSRANDHANLMANTLVLQHCTSYDFDYVGEAMAYISKPPSIPYFGGEATARWY